MLRVKEAQKYFSTLHFDTQKLLNNVLNWRGYTTYATVQTDLSGPGNRGFVVPVEQGAKVKDFPIYFEAFIFANSKSPKISDETLKFQKI